MTYKTNQEEFWAGTFGENYINRNNSEQLLASNIFLFSEIFQNTNMVDTIIEFGSNIGLNLQAIKTIMPDVKCSAVEINCKAAEILKNNIPDCNVINKSIFECELNKKFNVVLVKGVLIHINPDSLNEVYEKMYQLSNKYIIIAEYYNPTPTEVVYQGNKGKLFKRDFTGEMLKKYQDLRLIDYGFKYHKDPISPQDDITWFLLSK